MITSGSQTTFVPSDYQIFAGLDVDKTSIAVTIMSHEQKIKSMRLPYDAGNLLNYVRKNFPKKKVAFAYEVGPTGYGLFDTLTAHGNVCLVVAPAMVPTAPGHHVKTNRLDSQKLAESLRGGQLKSIHVPTETYRQLRHLIQLRDTFVRQAVADKNRIKALLLFEGIAFPEAPASNQWSSKVIKQLQQISCNQGTRFKLSQLIANLEFAQKQAKETIREIRRFCEEDSELRGCIGYLTSIPGIGWITASHILARIGNWREMKNVRQLGAFFGVAPREESTGEDIKRGPITRAGDSRLLNKLIQCAWMAIRMDPELREFYRRVYESHHRDFAARKAIVAVVRKLSTRIYAVLKEQRPYVIRHGASSVPLTQEEIECSKGRLDDLENRKGESFSRDSMLETETLEPLVPEADLQTEKPGQRAAQTAAHLKPVRRSLNRATNCRESFLSQNAESAIRRPQGVDARERNHRAR